MHRNCRSVHNQINAIGTFRISLTTLFFGLLISENNFSFDFTEKIIGKIIFVKFPALFSLFPL